MMQQQEQQEYLLEESLDSTSANFFGVSLDSETSEVMEAREMAMMDGDLDEEDDEEYRLKHPDEYPPNRQNHEEQQQEGKDKEEKEEEILEHSIDFYVNRASVSRSGLIPCCVFVGRIRWGTTEWEIHFGQKQIIRLHFCIIWHLLWYHHQWSSQIHLPFTIWREKRAEKRIADVTIVQDYIRSLLKNHQVRNSEPLLSFLEVSPSRIVTRYGPSLKEGYMHMRMNGAFQLPLYKCFNRTIENLYRHLYRTWMRILFVSVFVLFVAPTVLFVISTMPKFFKATQEINQDGITITKKVNYSEMLTAIPTFLILFFCVIFIYKFFQHRVGTVRRWCVLKPNCIAGYRHRSDKEPSEVFLFDKHFSTRKGNYRQGVAWMPSGFIVGSNAGFIELDTGHYYTRLTTTLAMSLVCYFILTYGNEMYGYKKVILTKGMAFQDLPKTIQTSWNLSENIYCGYSFLAPSKILVRAYTHDVAISDLTIVEKQDDSTNMTLKISGTDLLSSTSSVDFNVNLISQWVEKGKRVGVTKKMDFVKDSFLPTGFLYQIEEIGTIMFDGHKGGSLTNFIPTNYFCEIPIDIAEASKTIYLYLVMILIVGGIVAVGLGLLCNYLMIWIGIWHSHVRRDHWFNCIKRVQHLGVNNLVYRYDSFAPQRISSIKVNPNPTEEKTDIPTSNTTSSCSSSNSCTNERMAHAENGALSNAISWHVDGEDTYEAMYRAISEAKYEILIAGWWVCPDLFLLRPTRKLSTSKPPGNAELKEQNEEKQKEEPQRQNDTQLRRLLLRKAEAGVKVYVLIYREVKLALTLNSSYTKRSLSIHPNIRVLRDPIFQIQVLGFWSHHEKIVCIDQALAFVGGLDLCFGRYDHSDHPLTDPSPNGPLQKQIWPGKDYSNPIIKDFVQVNKPFEDLVDRNNVPRMPWHDVHCSISGPAVQDIAYHFIQRWNFVCSKNDYQLRTGWCICLRSRRFKYLPKCLLPMDFSGCTVRYPSDSIVDTVSSSTHLSTEGNGDGAGAGAAATNRQETKDENTNDNTFQLTKQKDTFFEDAPFDLLTNPLMSSIKTFRGSIRKVIYGDSASSSTPEEEKTLKALKKDEDIHNVFDNLTNQQNDAIVCVSHPNAKICNVQIVRSVSMWSAGVPIETSVHSAYLDLISKSKHYLYIENQFFISGLHSNGVVSNRILQAIVDRIKKAIKEKQIFRVYVVMPLLPAFEGNIRSEELTNLHAVMHWQFESICRGKFSLFSALKKVTKEPEQYVSFFGLRQYGLLPNGCMSTEQIYIHSKLLIVDDQYVILGSANINDRSMNGDRDSEIAIVMEDILFEEGFMNGKKYSRGILAGALRIQLFCEHLGLRATDLIVLDPILEISWRSIKALSSKNTQIYESVFDCAPSNKMRTFASFHHIEMSQIYENQRMNPLKGPRHAWDKENLKEGDYSPWTDVNGIPIQMERINLDEYMIDRYKDKNRKHLFSMDQDGWCYARNFRVFQEVRTGATDYRKRDKLQHFMTDRLMAQVRRRRWIKKGSSFIPGGRGSSFYESDQEIETEDYTNRFLPWKRSSKRANSVLQINTNDSLKDEELLTSQKVAESGGPLGSSAPTKIGRFDNDDTMSPKADFHIANPALSPNAHGFISTRTSQRGSQRECSHQELSRESSGSTTNAMARGLGQLKKWYSYIDRPGEGSRRSQFNAEYFGGNNSVQDHWDTPNAEMAESDGASTEGGEEARHSNDERNNAATGNSSIGGDDQADCQISHVQTAATVPKEGEQRVKIQLSEIRGHLVDFPLEFLSEEILKPSILPRDIHL